MDFTDAMMAFLTNASDPAVYALLLMVYTLLNVIFLPVPVEAALFIGNMSPLLKALLVGTGKAIGSIIVLKIGASIGDVMNSRMMQWGIAKSIVNFCNWMVARFHYLGLYIILSIPFMVDTVPVYIFSIFNEQGFMETGPFAVVNFLAGINRVLIVLLIFALFGIKIGA
ncbi:MAG: hypothetical protein PHW93_00955 [Candidatus Methanomethylophilaceae archaeon]|nr:hypothetical protein [Candidatus Methanomethylophilaceae archaeon]